MSSALGQHVHFFKGPFASLTSIVFDKFLQTRGPPLGSGSLPGSKLQEKANPLRLLRAVLLAMLRDMLRRLRDMLRDLHRMVSCRRLGDVLLAQAHRVKYVSRASRSHRNNEGQFTPPGRCQLIRLGRPLRNASTAKRKSRFHQTRFWLSNVIKPRVQMVPPRGRVVWTVIDVCCGKSTQQVLQPEWYIRHAKRPTIKHQLEEYLGEVVGGTPDQ